MPPEILNIQLQTDRAMIRAGYVLLDPGIFYLGREFGRNKEVIDAPAHVSFAGFEAVGPPRVFAGLVAVDQAEGIHVTRLDKAIQPGPFEG